MQFRTRLVCKEIRKLSFSRISMNNKHYSTGQVDSRDPYEDRIRSMLSAEANGSASEEQVFKRIHSLYLPIFHYIKNQKNSVGKRPLMVGISAPQGCGKTTLTNILSELFSLDGTNCISMSLDDFYLTGNMQDEVAFTYNQNPLLKYRGNAGTHDLKLLMETISGCKDPEDPESVVAIPRYDKSLRSGRGDRVPKNQWDVHKRNSIDIVLLEGWMLGFTPIQDQIELQRTVSTKEISVPRLPENMVIVDDKLKQYRDVHYAMDAWIVLALPVLSSEKNMPDTNVVYRWRLEAEQEMSRKGKPAMTDAQVQDFVSRFMPAYDTYLPFLYEFGPQRKRLDISIMKIVVGQDRNPIPNDDINIKSKL